MIKLRFAIVSILLTLMLSLSMAAVAQCPVEIKHESGHQHETAKKGTKLRTEWGVGVGAVYTMLKTDAQNVMLKPKFGYQGYVQIALLFRDFFGLKTEVCYSGGSVQAALPDAKFERRVRTSTIDIPIFLSFRLLKRIHINLGPQFTVMSRAEYTYDNQTGFFGGVYPTFNLAGSVGVKLFKNLMFEARYIHPLKKGLNRLPDVIDGAAEGIEFNTSASRITAGLTLVF